MKRLLSFLLALAIIICAVPMGAFTVSAATSGTMGDCEWLINDTTLIISGEGSMGNIPSGYVAAGIKLPWYNVKTAIIQEGVTEVPSGVFYDCKSLTSVTIPDSATNVGDGAFEGCTSLTSVSFGNGVERIGHFAFLKCKSLTSITIPDSVVDIGYSAFSQCTSLTNITIPDAVVSIGDFAFSKCTSLKSVILGNGVLSIGSFAFRDCECLMSITFNNSSTGIGCDAFYNTAYYNDENNWENDVLYIDKYLIEASDYIDDKYVIKDGTLTIASYAFYECISLTSLTVPISVTNIGECAFDNCSRFEQVWYMGSENDKQNIVIGLENTYLMSAIWYYNTCGADAHIYNDISDITCENCEWVRSTVRSGDTNSDGILNNRDLAAMMQYINNPNIQADTAVMDVNADGKANNKDYVLLMRYLNGWDVELQ